MALKVLASLLIIKAKVVVNILVIDVPKPATELVIIHVFFHAGLLHQVIKPIRNIPMKDIHRVYRIIAGLTLERGKTLREDTFCLLKECLHLGGDIRVVGAYLLNNARGFTGDCALSLTEAAFRV